MTTPIPNISSWPLGNVNEQGELNWSKDDDSIREVILNILLTRPGERLQRPDFGAGLLDFVHQPNNQTTRNLIAGVVKKSLQLWEPRIEVESVDVQPSAITEVHINIHYRLLHNPMPAQLGLTLNLGA